jgi:hypothetical protein
MIMVSAVAGAQTAVTTTGGTTNAVPVYTGTATLGNSPFTVSGSMVGICTTSPATYLDMSCARPGSGVGQVLIGSTGNAGALSFRRASDGNALGQIGYLSATESNNLAITSSGGYGFITFTTSGSTERMRVTNTGNVGIGTTSPGAKLEVNGSVKLTANSGASITFADGTTQSTAFTGVLCGGDYAESVDPTGERAAYTAGDVLILDETSPGKIAKSTEAYSTLVAGVYSTKPGVVGRRQTTPKTDAEVPMAMVGIVPTKVSTVNGSIHVGDLLVSSSKAGYAMRGTDRGRMLGAVLGKAMNSLESGDGVIEVLVTLQ